MLKVKQSYEILFILHAYLYCVIQCHTLGQGVGHRTMTWGISVGLRAQTWGIGKIRGQGVGHRENTWGMAWGIGKIRGVRCGA